MKKFATLFLALALLISFSSCFKAKAPTVDSVVETREIELNVGDIYQIKLEGNATTGYLWSFKTEFDGTILQYKDQKVERPDNNNIVGAPEINIWEFEAMKEGITTATLEYKRPWEKEEEPLQTIHYKITILP